MGPDVNGALIGKLSQICVDSRVVSGPQTGVVSYASNLLASLKLRSIEPLRLVSSLLPDERPTAGLMPMIARTIVAACPRPRRGQKLERNSIVVPDVFRQAQRYFDLYGRAMPILMPGPPGLMHSTYPMPIRAVGWRNIYTIHDLIPLLQPDLTPIDRRRHMRLLRSVMASASQIVTVSESVREDIIRVLGLDQNLVTDCGQGVAPPSRDVPAPPGLRSGGYFLFVGSIESRKNLVRLAHAYDQSGAHRHLVVAGPRGWHGEEIEARLLEVAGINVRRDLASEDIMSLLVHARALLMPSLAEGFGLPVVEAMAAGVPVMTSNFGAMREVAGGAALLVDPLDCDAMACAIRRLDCEAELCESLVQAGKRRAVAFGRDRHGEALVRLYRAELAKLPVLPA